MKQMTMMNNIIIIIIIVVMIDDDDDDDDDEYQHHHHHNCDDDDDIKETRVGSEGNAVVEEGKEWGIVRIPTWGKVRREPCQGIVRIPTPKQ